MRPRLRGGEAWPGILGPCGRPCQGLAQEASCAYASVPLQAWPAHNAHPRETARWGSGHSLGAGGCPPGAPDSVAWQRVGPVLFTSVGYF